MSEATQVAFFAQANQVHIERSSFTVHNSSKVATNREGFKALQKATAPAAFYNSGERHEPPKCHPRTREAILKRIMSWVKGEIDAETFVFWLNGTVGVGKSAIAQTIAEMCEKEGLLLASFFFARSDPTRNNAKLLITTLASQIALALPAVRSHIVEAFERDPFIHTRSLETQAVKLLVEPLEHAIADQIHIPPLIVVDGLDECHYPSEQCKVLDIVSRVGGAVNVTSSRLVFLVATRPEQEISLKFGSRMLEDVSSQYSINTSPDSENDLRRFLEDGFKEIKKTHPLKSNIPASWPSERDFNDLLWLADRQFLYATLALSYTSSIRHRPTDRLAAILHVAVEAVDNPFTTLDALYHHIFSTVDNMQSLLTILGLRLASHLHDMHDIVRWRLGMEFEDVKLLFGDLVSVIEVNDSDGSEYLTFRHGSLVEFLLNERRSKEYHIQMGLYHAEWVVWRLEQNVPFGDSHGILHFAMHFPECHPSPQLQAALQAHAICGLYAQRVWENASSVSLMYHTISSIQDMKFDDAAGLYQFQLEALKHHIISLLGGINARPLTAFSVMLLLSTSALSLWQEAHAGLKDTPRALRCIFGWGTESSGPHARRLCDEFRSFLSTLLHDPDRGTPWHCAVNNIRTAVGPVLLHCLSRPDLTDAPSLKWFSGKLKTRPWRSRTRSSLRKKKLGTWCKLYTCCYWCSSLYSRNCIHDDPDDRFWILAHHSPTPPHVLVLQDSPSLLAYFYALVLLPEVLSKAPRSEELIISCKTHIFHWSSILFPCRTKVAWVAISKYLERTEAEERRWKELWLD